MADPGSSFEALFASRHERPGSNDSPAAAFRILLIDPSALSRSCFIAALKEVRSIEISGVPGVEDLSPAKIEELRPNAIALRVAGENLGEEMLTQRLQRLGTLFPPAQTMLLARSESPDQLLCALRMGIGGFITTDLSLATTVTAIEMLRDGLSIFTYATFQSLHRIMDSLTPKGRKGELFSTPVKLSDAMLTSRQREVLQLLLDGLSNKMIAFRLAISESTVKVHIRAIMERAGVKSRAQIISRFLSEKR